MEKTVYLNKKYFRDSTRHNELLCNFFLSNGGLGDYINHMPAFEWLANENPHLVGRIFVNEPFLTVAKFIMSKYKKWRCYPKDLANTIMKEGEAVKDPREYHKFINATGSHLMDLGFMYYCTQSQPFEGYNRLPPIDYNGVWKWDALDPDSRYAVFTPGYTAIVRSMPADSFNELLVYTRNLGITPVFLGKKNLSDTASNDYTTKFNDGYLYDLGIDLREKTNLLEAVQIMKGARFVLGVDNGLLHFAGCTDTPIIFGHTVARVEHRKIRRPRGLTIDIEIDKKDLPCIGCQSNMRYILNHRFSKCIYGDNSCTEMLFLENSKTWKQAIDFILKVRK